jgi:hypothetical protein
MADFKAPLSGQNTGIDEKAGPIADSKEIFGKQKESVVFIERVDTDSTSSISNDPEPPKGKHEAVETDLQLVTRVLSVEDDPSENPWTFRMWFLGAKCPFLAVMNSHSFEQVSGWESLLPLLPQSIISNRNQWPFISSLSSL